MCDGVRVGVLDEAVCGSKTVKLFCCYLPLHL